MKTTLKARIDFTVSEAKEYIRQQEHISNYGHMNLEDITVTIIPDKPVVDDGYIYIRTPEDKQKYAPKLATDECFIPANKCWYKADGSGRFEDIATYRRRITTPPQRDMEWMQEHRDELIVMLADYSNITHNATTRGRSFQCASIYFDEQLTRLRSQKKDKV